MNTITVLRDTSSGLCYLTDFELDVHSIDWSGYEIAGQLANPHAVELKNAESDTHLDDASTPEFAPCERVGCSVWMLIDEEGGAPEHCTKHAEEVRSIETLKAEAEKELANYVPL